MSVTFGPIVGFHDVELAVKETLETWIDTYLSEVERVSPRWSGDRPIARPVTWEIVGEIIDIPGRLLPAISIESQGMARPPAPGGAHLVTGEWSVEVRAIVESGTRDLSRDILSVYEAAIRSVLFHRGDLGGLAAGVVVGASRHDLVEGRDRTRVGCTVPLVAVVDSINRTGGGPLVPDAPPAVPSPVTSPSDPDHLTTTVTVSEL